MSRGVPISEQVMDNRLGPARAHDIIRHRLGRLARRWKLSPADVHRLARQMQTSTYAPGETIVPHGARADCLGLVVRGRVAVYPGEGAAARPSVVLLPGSTFGEMMLADGRPSNATLKAHSRSEVRFLRRADMLGLRAEQRRETRPVRMGRLVQVAAVLLLAWAMLILLALPGTRQALAVVPMGLGQWCWDHGHSSCTARAWQVAVSLSPADPGPLLALGTFYFEHENIAAAVRVFRQAGELVPDLPEVHNNLGLIYARQGDHERAIAAFEQALVLEPGVAAVEHNLANSLQAVQSYEEALEHYQLALALEEPRPDTLLNMALAYYEVGEHDRAEEVAKQVLSQAGDRAAAHTLLAAVALKRRQPERALASLQQALYSNPGYEQAYFYRGLAYKALDQPEAAILSLEQALARTDDEVTRARILTYLNELRAAQGTQGGGGPD